MCLGFAVCASGWEDNFGAYNEDVVPCLGLDLGFEFFGRSRCELAFAREVSIYFSIWKRAVIS